MNRPTVMRWVGGLFVVGLCLTVWFGLRSSLQDDTLGPKILLSETKHDFGTVGADELREHRIRFKNVGYKPLEIVHQEADCGVQVEIVPRQPVLPGGYAEIILGVSGIKQSGRLAGTVTLGINNPKEPPIKIEVFAFLPDRVIENRP